MNEDTLARVHRCAKLIVRHLVSLNREKKETGRLWLAFDREELRRASDEGHMAVDDLLKRIGATLTEYCGVQAKCAHGVALQMAVRTLRRLDGGEPIESIESDYDGLLNLYAAIGVEMAVATAPVDEILDWCHSAQEAKPDEFITGSIEGTKAELNLCVCGKNDRNARRLESNSRKGKIWVVYNGRTSYSVCFKTYPEYIAAKSKLEALRDGRGDAK